ncbi:MAG TPA: hypothetical protein VGK38_12590, partial [Prolixibacteraceae bacterium]
MKSLLFMLIFLSFTAFGQISMSKITPTTEEEYNYLTKGYKIQIESGLDMKKGYKLQVLDKKKESYYTFQIQALIREEKNEIAGLLLIANSEISGKTYYLCIPQQNEQLLNRYYADINLWDSGIL